MSHTLFSRVTLIRTIFCLLLLNSKLAGGAVGAITLSQAIEYAIEHSPDLATAARQLEISDLKRKITRAGFLPSLDLQSTHGLYHLNPGQTLTDPWQSQVGLALKETFYDNGITLLQYDQAKINKEYAEVARTKARDQLCLQVTLDFYRYSLARHTRDLKAEQLKHFEKQFLAVSDMYKQGFKTRADFLRLKTQVQRARLDLIAADNDLGTNLVELKRAMGAPTDEEASLIPSTLAPDDLPTEIPAKHPAPEKTYETRLAEIQTRSNRINIDVAERSFWPNINLSAGANVGYGNYLGGGGNSAAGTTGWNVLATLNFNLLDWGIRRNQIEVASREQLVQENQLVQTKLASRATLDSIRLDFTKLKSEYSISHELLGLEQENYDLIRRSYQEGKVQYLDLIAGLNNLFSAKQSFLAAAFGLAEALAKYRYYEGTLYAPVSTN